MKSAFFILLIFLFIVPLNTFADEAKSEAEQNPVGEATDTPTVKEPSETLAQPTPSKPADKTEEKSTEPQKQPQQKKPAETTKKETPSQETALPLCPNCPAGCIPFGLIDKLKKGEITKEDACPEGCASINRIKAMLDEPNCRIEDVGEPAEKSEAEKVNNEKATRNRLILHSTGLGLEKGQTTITGIGLGVWNFQHGASDHFQIGTYFLLPVMVMGVIPTFQLHWQSEKVAFSIGTFGGFIWPYILGGGDDDFDFPHIIWLSGGKADFSLLSGKNVLNIGLSVIFGGDDDYVIYNGAYLFPHIGFRSGFHKNWSFQIEVTLPVPVSEGETYSAQAYKDHGFWFVTYGFRGHGELLFGDFGFTLPFSKSYVDYYWKYTPLGFPYFSMGFKF